MASPQCIVRKIANGTVHFFLFAWAFSYAFPYLGETP